MAAGASVSGQLLCDCAAERQRTGQRRKCLQAAQSACMVVGSEDAVVDPSLSLQMVEALSEQNAQAYITVIEGADHFAVPEEAYLSGRFDIIGWLIGGDSLPQEDFLH